MPQTKNAYTRYRLLDRCFRDTHRRYFIDDLLYFVNDHIDIPIGERQLRDDISYMESIDGWEISLDKRYDGHRKYYRYKNPNFSIMNMPLTQGEVDMLKDAIDMLSRFKGLPKYEWIEETLYHFQETFGLSDDISGTIVFAQNPELKGLHYFDFLINAIVEKKVLNVNYHKFGGENRTREIHPYQLRQYNNRWFLIGYEPRLKDRLPFVVVPIDRIEYVKIVDDIIFQKYQGTDIEEYFKDIVGVSLLPDKKPEKIVLRVFRPEADYIRTKPLHQSQKIKEETDEYIDFELFLKPNYEFETLLIGHAHLLKVLEPDLLRDNIKKRAALILKNT